MLTASRPNSRRISTAAVMISSASRSKSGCLVTRSHHHHKLADDTAVSHPLEGIGKVVERDPRRPRIAQATVSQEAGEAGMNAVELLTCVTAGEDTQEGGVRDDQVVRREVRPRAAREPDGQQSPVAGHRAGGVL